MSGRLSLRGCQAVLDWWCSVFYVYLIHLTCPLYFNFISAGFFLFFNCSESTFLQVTQMKLSIAKSIMWKNNYLATRRLKCDHNLTSQFVTALSRQCVVISLGVLFSISELLPLWIVMKIVMSWYEEIVLKPRAYPNPAPTKLIQR